MATDPATAQYIEAAHHRARPSMPPTLIVLHSTEGGEYGTAAEETARFFASGNTTGSAHFCVDGNSVVRCAPDEDRTNGAGGVNDFSLHIEQCGTAHQSRAEWLDDTSKAIITNAAGVAAYWIKKFPNIKPVRLSAADLAAGKRNGITDHISVTNAGFPSNAGHWDPGPDYPWDVFLSHFQTHKEQDVDVTKVGYTKDGKRWAVNGIIRTEVSKASADHIIAIGTYTGVNLNLGLLPDWLLDATVPL